MQLLQLHEKVTDYYWNFCWLWCYLICISFIYLHSFCCLLCFLVFHLLFVTLWFALIFHSVHIFPPRLSHSTTRSPSSFNYTSCPCITFSFLHLPSPSLLYISHLSSFLLVYIFQVFSVTLSLFPIHLLSFLPSLSNPFIFNLPSSSCSLHHSSLLQLFFLQLSSFLLLT